jgi:uncharacterized protein (DUF1697 family)
MVGAALGAGGLGSGSWTMSGTLHVALLRGINVAGKNKLAMADLAQVFANAGAREVRTYIQSGNVVFRARASAVKALATAVEAELSERHGISSPVMVRSKDALLKVTVANPFTARGVAPKCLHVVFLGDAPSAGRVRTLDPRRSPPDELVVCGREIFLLCPRGYGQSKLTNDYFERTLGTTSTVRNWNTVTKLAALVDEPPVVG